MDGLPLYSSPGFNTSCGDSYKFFEKYVQYIFSQGNKKTISVYMHVKTHLSLCLPSPSLLESFSIKIWLEREKVSRAWMLEMIGITMGNACLKGTKTGGRLGGAISLLGASTFNTSTGIINAT